MDIINERRDMIRRCLGQHAVAKIENVTGPTSSLVQNALSMLFDDSDRGKQCYGIQIALNRPV